MDEIGRAVADLRRLAAGVRPALLDEGLSAALDELARTSAVPVHVDAPRERLPPVVEAAAFFIACEAITNAVKHARPSRVRIHVHRDDGRLTMVVDDDGVGGACIGRGSGLQGLLDRVEAHGGELRLESPRGAAHGPRWSFRARRDRRGQRPLPGGPRGSARGRGRGGGRAGRRAGRAAGRGRRARARARHQT